MSSRRPDGYFPRRSRGGRGFFPRRGNFIPRGRKNYNPDMRQASRDYKRKFYDDDYKHHSSRSRSRYSRSRSRSPSYHRYRHSRSRSRSRSYSRSVSSRSRSRTPKRYRRSSSPRRYDRSHSRSPRKYDRSPSPRSGDKSKPSDGGGRSSDAPGSPKSTADLSLYDADVPIKPEGFQNKFIPIGEASKNVQKLREKEEVSSKSKDLPIYSDDDSNDNSNDGKDKGNKTFLRTLDENKDIRTILLERAMLEKKKLGLDNPGTSEKSSALEALRCYSPEPHSPVHEKASTTKKSILKNRCPPEAVVNKKQSVRTGDGSWSLRGTEKKTSVRDSAGDWAGILLALDKKHVTRDVDTSWQPKEVERKKTSVRDSVSDWNLGVGEKKAPLEGWETKQTEKKSLTDTWDFKAFERKPQTAKDKSRVKDPSPVLPTIPGLGFSSIDDEDAFLYGEEEIEEKKPVELKPKPENNQRNFEEQFSSRDRQPKMQKPPTKEKSGWSDEEIGTDIPYKSRSSQTPSPLCVSGYADDRKPSKRQHSHSWDRNDVETIDLQLSLGKSKLFSDDLLRVNKPSPTPAHKPSPAFVTKSSNDWEAESPPPKSYQTRRRSPDLTDDLMMVSSREVKRISITPPRESYQRLPSPQEIQEHFQERKREIWSDSPQRRSVTPERQLSYKEKRDDSPFFTSNSPYSSERKRYRSQSPYDEAYISKRDWSPYSNSSYRSPPPERMERSPFRERHSRYSPSPPPRGRYGSPGRNRNRYYDSPTPRKRRSMSPANSSSPSPRRRHRDRYGSPPRSSRRRQYSSSPSPVRNEPPHDYREPMMGGHQMQEQMHGPPPQHLSQQMPMPPQQPPQMQQFFNTNPPMVYQDPNFVQQFQAPPPQQAPFYPGAQFPVPSFPPPTSINFSIPPPNFPQQPPPPPAPQLPQGLFAQQPRTNLKVIPIQSEPLPQESPPVKEAAPSPVRHHFVPLTPVVEAAKLSEGQRRHLTCLCEEKKSRLATLTKDLEQLQKVQGEMMRKKQRQKDGHKDPLILENAKKQEELTRQINDINSTVAEAERRLGFTVTPKPEMSPPKTPVSKSEKKVKKEKAKEDEDHGSISKFEYFDPGSHWCELCNEVLPNIHAILEHMHDPPHREKMTPFDRPWKDTDQKKDALSRPNQQSVLAPIKGVQFLIPISGFYCKVCKNFMGDSVAAETHVKDNEHNKNYTKYTLSNPHYEKKWNNAKTHALNKLRKESRKKLKELEEKAAATKRKQEEAAKRKNKELIKAERQLNQETEELEEGAQQRSPSDPASKAIKLTLLGKQKKTVPVVYIGRAPNFRSKEESSKATFGKFNWSNKGKEELQKTDAQPKFVPPPLLPTPPHQFPLRKSKPEAVYQKPIGPEPPPNFVQNEPNFQKPSEGDIALAFSGNTSTTQTQDTFELIPMDLDEPLENDPPIVTMHKITQEEEKDLALLGINKEDFALLAKPRAPLHTADAEIRPNAFGSIYQETYPIQRVPENTTLETFPIATNQWSTSIHQQENDITIKTSVVSSYNSNVSFGKGVNVPSNQEKKFDPVNVNFLQKKNDSGKQGIVECEFSFLSASSLVENKLHSSEAGGQSQPKNIEATTYNFVPETASKSVDHTDEKIKADLTASVGGSKQIVDMVCASEEKIKDENNGANVELKEVFDKDNEEKNIGQEVDNVVKNAVDVIDASQNKMNESDFVVLNRAVGNENQDFKASSVEEEKQMITDDIEEARATDEEEGVNDLARDVNTDQKDNFQAVKQFEDEKAEIVGNASCEEMETFGGEIAEAEKEDENDNGAGYECTRDSMESEVVDRSDHKIVPVCDIDNRVTEIENKDNNDVVDEYNRERTEGVDADQIIVDKCDIDNRATEIDNKDNGVVDEYKRESTEGVDDDQNIVDKCDIDNRATEIENKDESGVVDEYKRESTEGVDDDDQNIVDKYDIDNRATESENKSDNGVVDEYNRESTEGINDEDDQNIVDECGGDDTEAEIEDKDSREVIDKCGIDSAKAELKENDEQKIIHVCSSDGNEAEEEDDQKIANECGSDNSGIEMDNTGSDDHKIVDECGGDDSETEMEDKNNYDVADEHGEDDDDAEMENQDDHKIVDECVSDNSETEMDNRDDHKIVDECGGDDSEAEIENQDYQKSVDECVSDNSGTEMDNRDDHKIVDECGGDDSEAEMESQDAHNIVDDCDEDDAEEEENGDQKVEEETVDSREAESAVQEKEEEAVENVSGNTSGSPKPNEEDGHEGGDLMPLDFVVLDEVTHREDSEGVDPTSDPCKDDVSQESDGESTGSDGTIIMGDVELVDEAKCSDEEDENNEDDE